MYGTPYVHQSVPCLGRHTGARQVKAPLPSPKSDASFHARRHLAWFANVARDAATVAFSRRVPLRERGGEKKRPGAREGCRESVLQNQHGCGTVSAVRIRVSTFSLFGTIAARSRARYRRERDAECGTHRTAAYRQFQHRCTDDGERRKRRQRARARLLSIAAAPPEQRRCCALLSRSMAFIPPSVGARPLAPRLLRRPVNFSRTRPPRADAVCVGVRAPCDADTRVPVALPTPEKRNQNARFLRVRALCAALWTA